MCTTRTKLHERLLSNEPIDQIVQDFKEAVLERNLLFAELIDELFNNHPTLSVRACMIFQRIAYHKPSQENLKTCMERILAELRKPEGISLLIRYELIRFIEHQTKYRLLNINYLKEVRNICFDNFRYRYFDHSIQLFSISILHNIKKYKVEIGKEAEYLLKIQMDRQAKVFSMIGEEYDVAIKD